MKEQRAGRGVELQWICFAHGFHSSVVENAVELHALLFIAVKPLHIEGICSSDLTLYKTQ